MGTKTDKKTLTKDVKDYFSERIDTGAKVDSESSTQDLTNQALDHFKRGANHKGWFNKLLKQTLIDKNISLGETGFTGKGGNLKYKIKKTITQVTGTPQTPIQVTTKDALGMGKPAQVGQQPPIQPTVQAQGPQVGPQLQPQIVGPQPYAVRKMWTDAEKRDMLRMFEKGGEFLGKLYKKTGLIQTKKVEKDEPMTEEEFDKDVKELCKGWADYCIAHDIELPTWIELFMLSAWTFFTFGSPLISVLISGKPKNPPKEDQKLKDVKSESEVEKGGDTKI